MKLKVYLNIFLSIIVISGCTNNHENNICIKNANSHDNYFSVHKINQAWIYGKGQGIKIRVLDHLFGNKVFDNFYYGEKSFLDKKEQNYSQDILGHGFWMSSTLKEIAPKSEVYALTVYNTNEDITVRAIIDAINWSIENKLNILTYSQARISSKNRLKLDPYINKAYENGIAIVFLHNPNKLNFLPSTIDPKIDNINNEPEFNIYDQDYSVIRREEINENGFVDKENAFLSISSKAVVLAGIISLIKESNPNSTLDQIRNALKKTAYNYQTEERYLKNTVNVYEAIKYLSENN